jgi:hypothetical protein
LHCVKHNVPLFYYCQLDTQIFYLLTQVTLIKYSTCFELISLIIRRSTTQIVHMQPLVSSLSTSDCLVQPLRKAAYVQFASWTSWWWAEWARDM